MDQPSPAGRQDALDCASRAPTTICVLPEARAPLGRRGVCSLAHFGRVTEHPGTGSGFCAW